MNSRISRQKDYYRILGVPTYASADDIKKAYRKLAFQYHPDRTRGNRRAEERFKEISEAYRVLTDEGGRKSCDLNRRVPYGKTSARNRRNAAPPGRGCTAINWAERGDLSDLFFELSKKGVDFQSPTFQQVLFGRDGVFSGQAFFEDPHHNAGHDSRIYTAQNGLKASAPKRLLDSLGKKLGGLFSKNGNGVVTEDESVDLQFTLPVSIYEAIRGGEKRISLKRGKNTEKLLVKIPPGVKPGMKLRLRGKGRQGRAGLEAGDLYFKINVQ